MSTYDNFTIEIDGDGIALVTWDMPDRSMNVFTQDVVDEVDRIVDDTTADDAVKGVVITSGKKTFSGGADLKSLETLLGTFKKMRSELGEEAAMSQLFDGSRRMSQIWRKLETCGKPWVSAINGTCMGGAFELSLACHGRVIVDDDKARVGLPEVKVGLFPGAGGTQRVMRMTEPQGGLMMLMQGQHLKPAKAKSMKLVDQVVPAAELIPAAKKMILDGLKPVQPWDQKGFKAPGGRIHSPAGYQFWPAATALYRKMTYDNYPAARAILKSVHDGLQLPMDLALQVESRQFAHILQTPEAAAMIRSLFVNMQDLNKGARRPAGVPESNLRKVGILGAGFMGAGVAYVTAMAGLEVVLLDRDIEAAEKGKAHSDILISGRIKKGRATEAQKEDLLNRIKPTADYADLAGCDLVIEAVFEDRDIKATVTRATEAVLGEDAIYASNTSTLPITSLAEASARPDKFIGIHFFSPVDKMMLVEIIMGGKTQDKALAVALDYVRAIRKTPIVVNDSRGFYTSRVVGTYINEGHAMLAEGVPAAMIENVAKMAGMPVGPLSLNDEVAVDLSWKIIQATAKDMGDAYVQRPQDKLIQTMVEDLGRLGRKNGKGFYDYPEGGKKHIWPGLADLVGVEQDADEIDIEELKHRFLAIQALETARCFEEAVLTDVREGDVGSILGFGFAPYSGGTLSYIDGMGTAKFVALCEDLAAKYGDRFKPNRQLVELAQAGETYYGKFPPEGAVEAAA